MEVEWLDSGPEPEPEEYGIVWLLDPLRFSYLREGVYATTHPLAKPGFTATDMALLVGYSLAIPRRGCGKCCYRRRVWWLKKHDRDLQPNGVYRDLLPAEAVDPSSILPNRASRQPAHVG